MVSHSSGPGRGCVVLPEFQQRVGVTEFDSEADRANVPMSDWFKIRVDGKAGTMSSRTIAISATLMIFLAACGGGLTQEDVDAAVQAALASTSTTEGQVTTTLPSTTAVTSTSTTATTSTTQPTTTSTTVDVAAIRTQFVDVVVAGLEDATGSSGEFERVDRIAFEEGVLEIEGHLRWASKDRQANSQWLSIGFIAEFFSLLEFKDLQAVILFDGPPRIHLVTVAADGDYRYESITDWQMLKDIGNRSLSFEGWVESAQAGFR